MDYIKKMWKYIHAFSKNYSASAKAIGLGIVGLIVLWLITRLINKSLKGKLPSHMLIMITKAIRYGGLVVLASSVLTQLGFNITALLGAAGVIGVAIGFASQTSVSNIISGMFLIIEHPFQIGDNIQVGSIGGKVQSIDLLAVRLKTPDGRLVRIPNESLIKSSVENKTFYSSRRITLSGLIDGKQDVARVIAITQSVLQAMGEVRKEPAPSVTLSSSTMWTVELCIQCWVDARKVTGSTDAIVQALYDAYQKENLSVSIGS